MATLTKCSFVYDSVRQVATWKPSPSLEDITSTTWEATTKSLKLKRHIRLCYRSQTESPTFNQKNSILSYFPSSNTKQYPHRSGSCQPDMSPSHQPENMITHIGMLKSLLQKAVRRQMSATALSCAKTYMDLNATSFLRRLLIISCEDVFLDPISSINIVWFYVATLKCGYQLSVSDKNYFLSYVAALCKESRYIDPFPIVVQSAASILGSMRMRNVQLRMCLELYNAMCQFTLEGDERMLKIWQHAFADPDIVSHQPILSVDMSHTIYGHTDYVTSKTYSLIGIDFHNFPKVISYLDGIVRFKCDEDVVPELAELIKSAIWYKRSSINTRKPRALKQLHKERQREIEDIWFVIEYPLDTFCKKLLLELKN
jgi:hypothetical protein